ncbi:dermokine isoform X2 [Tamandua tetradactyla]|uniref:dermokine isoform X2 n=1 Tax=Tamandua tetradactyla TaxID=48850 RepID=UPI004053C399
MDLQRFLGCLLLALCLGSGAAIPLMNRGQDAETGIGGNVGHGIEDTIDHAVREAVGKGVEEAMHSGNRDALGSEVGDAIGHRFRDTIYGGAKEAAHAVGNTGGEAGRQAEGIIQHGLDAAHGSWQGMPGSNGVWGTNGQPPIGGHGISGSQSGLGGNPGGSWGQRYPGASVGSFGTNSQGGSWGQGGYGGPFNLDTNAQGAVAQPGYESVRSSSNNQNVECTNPPPSGFRGSSSNSGGSSSSQWGSDSSSGGSSSSSSRLNWKQPLENARNFDQNGYSGFQGSNTGSSSGSSGGYRGGNKPGCDNPGSEVRVSGGSGGQGSRGGPGGPSSIGTREVSRESSHLLGSSQGTPQGQWSGGENGEGEAVSGINTLNSQTSPGFLNLDSFWKNLKSRLGFINWDAISKSQVPSPSTRALLYFSRLWEDFKHNTPFFNWKAIIEGAEASALQKRAAGAGQFSQSDPGWQEGAAVTSKAS